MSVQSFAREFKEFVVSVKEKGTEAIYCDDLIAYFDEVSKQDVIDPTETELEDYRAQLQKDIDNNKSDRETDLEVFRSVLSAGQQAMRSSFLLNGGASVALLAFIGHLATSNPGWVSVFAFALIPFVTGVLAITITSGFAYLTQLLYANETESSEKIGIGAHAFSIILGLSSYCFFIWGMYEAYIGFKAFG